MTTNRFLPSDRDILLDYSIADAFVIKKHITKILA